MKIAIALLLAALAAGCSAPRTRVVDTGGLAPRVGLPSDVTYTAHRCSYAQALPEDDDAEFFGGATCVVYPDRLAIIRARGRTDRPAWFRYKALEGVAMASSGWRNQLQMLAAGTVVVVEMDASGNTAQQRAFATAKREGVPEFQADFVHARHRNGGPAFVPPSF